jgi:signal transduction histidine kinase
VRVRIFWFILIAIYAFAGLVTYIVQPENRGLQAFHVLKSQSKNGLDVKNQVTIQLDYHIAASQSGPVAIMAPAHYGELAFALNGIKIEALPTRNHMQISRYHKLYEADIPQGLLRAGANDIKIERTGTMRLVGVPDVYIGPKEALRAYGDHQQFLITWVDRATLIIILLGVFVTAGLLFFSRKIAHYFYFFLMFALLIPQEFRNYITIFGYPLMSYMTYIGLTYLILSALSFSYWTDGAPKERHLVWALGASVLAIVAALDLVWGLDSEKTVFARAGLFVACGIAMVVWLTRRLARQAKTMPAELVIVFAFASAFSLGYVIALVTLFGNVSATTRLFLVCFTNIAETVAFAGLLATAAIYELRAYQRELAQNAHLKTIVSGRLLQLDGEAQRLKTQITSSAVTEERQRFTRDIHDGIGGQLLSLLLKARSGTLTPDQAEADVASSIADLRLITAALDSSDDGLAFALNSFARRATDQLDAADMSLDWHLDPGFDSLRLDPRTALELLRWLQEGLANAIRHSGGCQVAIACRVSSNQDQIELSLRDNGKGYRPPPSPQSGRGIANMTARAKRLGGKFTINGAQTGTVLTLIVLIKPASVATLEPIATSGA